MNPEGISQPPPTESNCEVTVSDGDRALVTSLVAEAFENTLVRSIQPASNDKGVFSTILRVQLQDVKQQDVKRPASVIAKLPGVGANGKAAVASGAVEREALAYGRLLPGAPILTPEVFHILDRSPAPSFLMEDLGSMRARDQLAGLGRVDTLAVVTALARLHDHFCDSPPAGVRLATPATFPPDALMLGLEALRNRWQLNPTALNTFEELLADRARLVDRFSALPATLCHGDPRADNLVFRQDGEPVFFDWQQIAVQAGEADLAWLMATSLTEKERLDVQPAALQTYAQIRGLEIASVSENYRLSHILPGLAVLMLAQRSSAVPRIEKVISTSINRIAASVSANLFA